MLRHRAPNGASATFLVSRIAPHPKQWQ